MQRRTFLKRAAAAGATFALPFANVLGANDTVRMGALGIGSTVKIGGKGRADIRDFRKIAGVRVVAVCDCDTKHLDYERDQFKKWGEPVEAFTDFRRLLDAKDVDAVTIATPNHWHSLMTILACQAGKDVFVQKPASHNLFEGRQMVEAMRKTSRVVQATHGPRNSGAVEEAFEYARAGHLGKIVCAYGINYKPRQSIGKVKGPQPVPATCDHDLWCGPAPKKPLMRKYLHYDWHWDWDTGSGDLGNMGIHYMDACRWALGQRELPRHVISLGGRLGYDDDGETPNTMITLLDYEPAPIIFEVRGFPKDAASQKGNWNSRGMDQYRGVRIGTIVLCEGGYVQNGSAYDREGKLIRKFTRKHESTKQNFIDVVRSRKREQLMTDALEGHLSCGLVHMTNISYRLGREASPAAMRERIKGEKELGDGLDRMLTHLDANRIDLGKSPATLGPLLTLDPKTERFTGAFSEQANKLVTRPPRAPFAVPEIV